MKSIRITPLLTAGILGILLLSGCRKYSHSPQLPGAAYIRIFNGLTNFTYSDDDLVTVLQDKPVSARIRVYIDPPMDSTGILDTAAVEDNLFPRSFNYTPQPDQAGNNVYFDLDYPGSKVVQTSPSINGLDLSRWAAISAGKHHIVFTALPLGQTNGQQINSARFNILADTTIQLSQGHYYTLEPINKGKGFRLYGRDEGFDQWNLPADKINFRIVNLCTARQVPDTFDVYYNYHYFSDQAVYQIYNATSYFRGYVEYDDSLQLLGTVGQPFPSTQAQAPYMSIPLAPLDSSIYPDGTYRPASKRPAVVLSLYPHGQTPASVSPLFQFVCTEDLINLENEADTTTFPGMYVPNAYYTPLTSSYFLFATLSPSNLINPSSYPVAGGLSHYVFISGQQAHNESLITTIELMDNYSFSIPGGLNNYTIQGLRIYTTSVQNKYGNPYQ